VERKVSPKGVITSKCITEVVVPEHIFIKIVKSEPASSSQFTNLKVGEKYRIIDAETGVFIYRYLYAFVADYVYWSRELRQGS
jgi:hypothetical protein